MEWINGKEISGVNKWKSDRWSERGIKRGVDICRYREKDRVRGKIDNERFRNMQVMI